MYVVLLVNSPLVKRDVQVSPEKRALQVAEDPVRVQASENKAKRLKPELEDAILMAKSNTPSIPITLPPGLMATPPKDASSPMNIPPRSSNFPSLLGSEGTVYIDKSMSIIVLDEVLEYWPCIVTLPIGTGKTFILSMLLVWYDRGITPDERDKIFLHLGIGPHLQASKSKGEVFHSAGEHLCLLFDLGSVRNTFKGVTSDAIVKSIKVYFCRTLLQFLEKYKAELGFREFTREDKKSPVRMMERIVGFRFPSYKNNTLIISFQLEALEVQKRAKRPCTVFIGVDHIDAPLLHFVETTATNVALRQPQYVLSIVTELANFVNVLMKVKLGISEPTRRSKLLINSCLFTFHNDPWKSLHDISSLKALRETYGMSPEQADGVFALIPKNRDLPLSRPKLRSDLKFSESGARNLTVFAPPSADDVSSPKIYSFDLVFHYTAAWMGLPNLRDHVGSPYRALLQSIFQDCRPLLVDSNLRRKHHVHLSPIHAIRPSPLTQLWTDEQTLWTLLLCLGVLVVSDVEKHRADHSWVLEFRSQTTATKVCINCAIR